MITVASYNMRKAIGTDRRRMPERIVEVLHEIDADIVALQECDRRFGARLSAIPPELIADHTPYKPVDYDIRPGGIGWHGNAILVRKSAEILHQAALDIPMLEPRGAVMAEVRVHGLAVRVVGMHLDLSGLWRRRQARAILAHVAARPAALPTILMGDLNEWTLHGGCLREFMHQFRVLPTGRSFHSRRPMAALDRIIVSPEMTVIASGVHRTARAQRASDHLPIWARLHATAA
jgi:endonuclease/exonuclease/phosphatase family metal-dependent hydrolase